MIPGIVSSFGIIRDFPISERDSLWSHIVTLTNEPPDSDKDGKTTCNQTGIVHGLSISGNSVGEAENDDKGDDVDAAQDVDDVADGVLHVEVSGGNQRSASQNVGENGCEV